MSPRRKPRDPPAPKRRSFEIQVQDDVTVEPDDMLPRLKSISHLIPSHEKEQEPIKSISVASADTGVTQVISNQSPKNNSTSSQDVGMSAAAACSDSKSKTEATRKENGSKEMAAPTQDNTLSKEDTTAPPNTPTGTLIEDIQVERTTTAIHVGTDSEETTAQNIATHEMEENTAKTTVAKPELTEDATDTIVSENAALQEPNISQTKSDKIIDTGDNNDQPTDSAANHEMDLQELAAAPDKVATNEENNNNPYKRSIDVDIDVDELAASAALDVDDWAVVLGVDDTGNQIIVDHDNKDTKDSNNSGTDRVSDASQEEDWNQDNQIEGSFDSDEGRETPYSDDEESNNNTNDKNQSTQKSSIPLDT
ncbi:expressed unknown protein [Seminavis robusta]|uniref:Uncharacterized protein n=1 Tax=Seminavis robusta TaxID=568900 RepID=A0A9N8H631_9STRA|nr:expressed unknown protein [Seminavis robusta]|eukprot:Sro159_g071960.1 n/a (366) ;mRNA; f:86963-88060